MFRLQGQQISLQTFSTAHLEDPAYYAWLTDYEVVKTINRADYLTPVRMEDVRSYCTAVMASSTDIFLAIHLVADNRFVGTLRVSGLNWRAGTADIGILIGERAVWGKGVATDAIRTVGTYLFSTLGLRKLSAGLMAVNPAMLKVFTRLGFREEGVRRLQDRYEDGYCDHIYLGCFADEFRFHRDGRQQ
jgi:[ribosomal protein S5]-alanine N-acetyltransferase